MPIRVECPSCQTRLRVKDEFSGSNVKCPKCSERVAVPAAKDYEIEETDDDNRPSRRTREELDSPTETSDFRKERKRRRKKKMAAEKPLLVLRAGFGLFILLFFALEFGVALFCMGDNPPAQVKPGQAPPPAQMAFSLSVYACGLVSIIMLRIIPGVGSWASEIIDTSQLTGCTFWGLFICCGGLLTPLLMALLAISVCAHLLYDYS